MPKCAAPVLLLLSALCAGPALAAPTSAPAPAAAAAAEGTEAPASAMKTATRPGEWKDYQPAKHQAASGQRAPIASGTLVVLAYSIIWVVVLVYALLLGLRQRRLQRELAELRQRIARLSPAADAAGEAQAQEAPCEPSA